MNWMNGRTSSHCTYLSLVMCSSYGGAEAKMIRGGEERLRRPLSGSEAAKMVGDVELEEELRWRGFRRDEANGVREKNRERDGTVYI